MARFDRGYIRIERRCIEGDIGRHGVRLAVWVTLLAWANRFASEITWLGERKSLPEGSLVTSYLQLADHLSFSRDAVRRALQYLTQTTRIRTTSAPQGCIITILKYREFYPDEPEPAPPAPHHESPAAPPPATMATHNGELRRQELRKEKSESAVALPRLAILWNTHCGILPKVTACGSQRTRLANARWKEHPSEEYWVPILRRIASSGFCNGKNDRGWRADFDFFLRPETQNKVQEGKYDSKAELTEARRKQLGVGIPLPAPERVTGFADGL